MLKGAFGCSLFPFKFEKKKKKKKRKKNNFLSSHLVITQIFV